MNTNNKEQNLLEMINEIRNDLRANKNYEEADKIREKLNNLGITVNDRG